MIDCQKHRSRSITNEHFVMVHLKVEVSPVYLISWLLRFTSQMMDADRFDVKILIDFININHGKCRGKFGFSALLLICIVIN